MSQVDVVFAGMPQAYAEASDDGRLPALARQVAYALRRITGLGDALDMKYLLARPDHGLINRYMAEHPDECAGWDVIRDARGTLYEPHYDRAVPLGTVAVRDYLGVSGSAYDVRDDVPLPLLGLTWPTYGPRDRYGAVLYIEKEGFGELLRADRIAERWDLAVMSSKGYSVRAARDALLTLARRDGVKVLVAHDFDKDGVVLCQKILDEVPEAIDIGLRLDDVEDPGWDLAEMAESVNYSADPLRNLTRHGASDEEVAFLRETPRSGHRVELNALVGRRFVEWLEAKLADAGMEKVVPDEERLEEAYRRAYRHELVNRHLEDAHRQITDEAHRKAAAAEVPDDLLTPWSVTR